MTALSPTGVILGAGFSYVAGLPLAKDLFDCEFYVPSEAAERRFAAVLQSWRAWQSMHREHGPEQFLTEIYRSPKIGPVPWSWATEMVAAILATPLPHDRGPFQIRYAGRITRPVNVPGHNTFWDVVLSRFGISAVVTTNYDLLAERGLRHRPMQRPKRPGLPLRWLDPPSDSSRDSPSVFRSQSGAPDRTRGRHPALQASRLVELGLATRCFVPIPRQPSRIPPWQRCTNYPAYRRKGGPILARNCME
jgi:hypothetical protein